MKKTGYIIAVLSVVALAGCSKDFDGAANSQNGVGKVSIKVSADAPETRTDIIAKDESKYSVLWEADDEIAVVETSAATLQSGRGSVDASTFTDGTSAEFDVVLDQTEGSDYTYTAYYPYSAYADGLLTLNASQSPKENSADAAAALMYAADATIYGERPESLGFHFKHIAAYVKLTVNNLKKAEDDNTPIVSVEFSTDQPLAGTFKFDTSVSELSDEASAVKADVSALNVDGDFSVWFAALPTSEIKYYAIKVSTELYTYTKKVEVEGKSLKSGVVVRITAPMSDAEVSAIDYYTEGVVINGVRYSKDSENANSLEIAEDAVADVTVPVGKGGIFFIDDNSDSYSFVTTSSQGITTDVAVIGRYADHKTEFKMGAYWALRNQSGKLIFKNLKINTTDITAGYVFNLQNNNTPGGIEELIFEDCDIVWQKTFITAYNAESSSSIGNIVFRNCKLRCEATDNSYSFMLLQALDEGLDGFKTFIFENNIIYSPTAGEKAVPAFAFINQQNATDDINGSLSNLHITFKNNTLVDVISFGSAVGSAYFQVGKIGGVEFSKNILHSNRTDKWPAIMRVQYDYGDSWPAINLYRQENKVYGTNGWKLYFDTENSNSYFPAADKTTYPRLEYSTFETCDVENGIFKVKAEYSEYGSNLQ